MPRRVKTKPIRAADDASMTQSGMIAGTLKVELIREGIHSGDGSGIVASSFRVLRHLLDRLEDPETGEQVWP